MTIKYFLSGASGIRAELTPEVASYISYRLLSMHKAFKGNTRVWCEVSHHPKSAMQEVMLDSGAFTAFTKGHKVELNELVAAYDDTSRKLNKRIKHIWFINLDVIPGAYGRIAAEAEVKEALDRSDDNYRLLSKRYGRERVLPVFHQTESQARLRAIVGMAPFIAMGFRQDFAEEHRISCAEEALSYAHAQGAKVHGLATTGYKMLSRAPFDTVDSASWLYAAAMGKIIYTGERGDMEVVAVSSISPLQREPRAHFVSLTEAERALILSRVEAAGATLEQVQNDLSYRILVNAYSMREWLKSYSRPLVAPPQGLFSL